MLSQLVRKSSVRSTRQAPPDKRAGLAERMRGWLKGLTGVRPGTQESGSTRRLVRLRTLALEDRRLLSVTATLNVGVLDVMGDAGSDTVNVLIDDVAQTLRLTDDLSHTIQIDGRDEIGLAELTDALTFDLGEGDDQIVLSLLDNISITVVDDAAGIDAVSFQGAAGVQSSNLLIDAESISLSSTFSSMGDIQLVGAITIVDAVDLDATGQIQLDGTVTAGNMMSSLSLNAAGDIQITDTVLDLTSLMVTTDTSVQLGDLDFSTSAGTLEVQALTDIMIDGSISGSTAVDFSAGQQISITGQMTAATTGSGHLFQAAGTDISLGNEVSGFDTVSLDASTELTISNDITGFVDFGSTGTGVTHFDSSTDHLLDGGSVSIAGAVQVSSNLTVNLTGTANFGDTTAQTTGLTLELVADQILLTGLADFDLVQLNAMAITPTGGAAQISGTVSGITQLEITTEKSLTLGGAVTAGQIQLDTELVTINESLLALDQPLVITTNDLEIQGNGSIDGTQDLNLSTRDQARAIGLGGGVADIVADSLHLTELEMQAIQTTGRVSIGSASYTGQLSVYSLDLTGNSFDLLLQADAGSTVTITEQVLLGANHFEIDPPTDVVISAPMIAAGAGSFTITALNNILFQNTGSLTTSSGAIELSAGNDIRFDQTVSPVLQTDSGAISLTADSDNDTNGQIDILQDSEFSTATAPGSILLAGSVTSTSLMPASLNIVSAGDVTVEQSVMVLNLLSFDAAGTLLIEGGISDVSTLQTSSNGTTEIDTVSISVGTADFGNAVTVLQDVSFSGTGDITFQQALSGSGIESLDLTTDGSVSFDGPVTDLALLDNDALVTTTFGGNVSNTSSLLTSSRGTTEIDTASISVGTADFGNAVTLLQDLSLAATGDVTYQQALSGSGIESLDVTTDGSVNFLSTVSGLTLLDVDALGVTTFNGDISSLTTLQTSSRGTTEVDTASMSVGTVDFGNAVTLLQDLSLSSSNDVTFQQALSGSGIESLDVTTDGNVNFLGIVSDLNLLDVDALGVTTLGGDISNVNSLLTSSRGTAEFDTASISVGTADFGNAVTLLQDLSLAATGDVTFQQALSGSGVESLDLTTDGSVNFLSTVSDLALLEVDALGTTTHGGDISNVTSLLTSSRGTTEIDTASISVGTADFGNAVTLLQDLSLTATGDVIFQQALSGSGVESLDVTTDGNLNFQGAVSDLNLLDIDALGIATLSGDISNVASLLTSTRGTTEIDTASVNVGTVDFGNAVTLLQDVSLIATGDVSFQMSLAGSGLESLQVMADGNASFDGTVSDLSQVEVDALGTTTFGGDLSGVSALITSTRGTTELDTASISLGTADFGNAVTLLQDLMLTASGDVTFQDTFAGSGAESLEITTDGNLSFNGTITDLATLDTDALGTTTFAGDLSGVTNLLVSSRGSTEINTPSMILGTADFGNAVTLLQDLMLTAVGDLAFQQSLAGSGTESLDVTTDGSVSFTGTVSDMSLLDIDALGTTVFGGDISNVTSLLTSSRGTTEVDTASISVGTADFGNAATLLQDLSFSATGDITFQQPLSGSGTESLDITTDGSVSFAGISDLALLDLDALVKLAFGGDISNVTTLLTSSRGITEFDTGSISVGTADFGNAVTLLQDLSLSATGDLTLQQTLSGSGVESLDVTTDGSANFLGTIADLALLDVDVLGVTTFGGDISNVSSLLTSSRGTTEINTASISVGTADFGNDVSLLQDLTFIATGDVTFQQSLSGSGVESLDLTAEGNVSFLGTVTDLALLDIDALGLITVDGDISNVASLQTSSRGATEIDTASLSVGTALFGNDVTLLQSLSLTSSGDVEFQQSVMGTGTESLEITTDGNLDFLGTASNLSLLDLDALGTTTFAGDVSNVVTLQAGSRGTTEINTAAMNVGSVDFGNAVTLLQDVSLTAVTDVNFQQMLSGSGVETLAIVTDGNVNFLGAVADLFVLDIDALGTTKFGGNISSVDSLLTSSRGSTQIDTTSIQVGMADFGNAVSLLQNLTLTATNSVTFQQTLSGSGVESLEITTEGSLTFLGTVTDLALLDIDTLGTLSLGADVAGVSSLIVSNRGTTEIDTASISVGTTDFGNAVTLLQDLMLIATGDVTFQQTLSGSGVESLNLTTDGNVNFLSTVSDLALLDIDALGITTFGGNVSNTSSLLTSSRGTTEIDTASISVGTADFGNAVTLLQDLSLTANGDVTFQQVLSGIGIESLDITTDGNLSFAGPVNDLALLVIDALGVVTFGADLSGITSLIISARGTTEIDTASISVGTADFGNAVTLLQDLTLIATGDVSFQMALTGSGVESLGISTDGNVNFASTISDLAQLDLDALGITTFGGNISNVSSVLTSSRGTTDIDTASISVDTADFANAVILLQDLMLTATGSITFQQAVSGSGAESLEVTTDGSVGFGSTVSDLTLLDLDALGVVTFSGDLSGIASLMISNRGTTEFDTASISVGTADFGNAVTLLQDLSLTATSDVTFQQSLSGSGVESLDISTDGSVNFLGANADLFLLDVDALGTTTFGGNISNVTSLMTSSRGTTEIDTASISVGTAEFGNAVTLLQDLSLTASSDMTFQQTLSGSGLESLEVTTDGNLSYAGTISDLALLDNDALGTTTFGGNVSNITSLLTSSRGSTEIDTATISVGTVDFGNAVILLQDLSLSATGDVTFQQALSGSGAESLDITTDGNVNFESTVSDLALLDLDALGITTFGGDISNVATLMTSSRGTTEIDTASISVGTTDFGNAVTLLQDLMLTATGDIAFQQSLSGSGIESLSILTDGNMNFLNTVSDLALLDVDALGTTTFSGDLPNVSTLQTSSRGTTEIDTASFSIGTADFGNPVMLLQDLTLTASGDVTFQQTLSGSGVESFNVTTDGSVSFLGMVSDLAVLDLDALGVTTFGGDISAVAAMQTSSRGTTEIDTASISVGSADFGNAVTLLQDLMLTTTGDVTFQQSLSGSGVEALSLAAEGNVQFLGMISDLALLDLDNLGTTTFAGDLANVTTLQTSVRGTTEFNTAAANVGTADFGNAVTLLQDLSLVATGDVTFQQALSGSGAESLDVTTDGNVNFLSTVSDLALLDVDALGGATFGGDISNVTSLLTSSRGTTEIDTASISVGTADFGNVVTLLQDLTLTASGDVTFQQQLAGSGFESLDLTTDGSVIFAGISDLALLDLDALVKLTFGGDISNVTNLLTSSRGTTEFDTASVSVGTADFGNPTSLLQDLSLTATGDITFQQSVSGNGVESLDVTTDGSVSFLSTISDLALLDVDALGTTTFGGNISNVTSLLTSSRGTTEVDTASISVGTVDFANAVNLLQDLSLAANGDVTFQQALSGSGVESLDVTTDGSVSFLGTVSDLALLDVDALGITTFGGNISNVTSLLTSSRGTTEIDTASIVVDTVDFGNAVTLLQDLSLTASSDVTFQQMLSGSGSESLDITTDGNLSLAGPVTDMALLDLDALGVVTLGADLSGITTLMISARGTTEIDTASISVGTADFGNAVTLLQDLSLTATGDVTFRQTLSGSGLESLDITTDGSVSFDSSILDLALLDIDALGTTSFLGNISNVSSLITSSRGSTLIDTSSLSAGTVLFGNPVSVLQDLVLTATGDVTFQQTFMGTGFESVELDVLGSDLFQGDVTALALLDVTATGGIEIDTSLLQSERVLLQSEVVIDQNLELIASQELQFASSVMGASGQESLTIFSTAGTIDFLGAVGSLQDVTIHGAADVLVNQTVQLTGDWNSLNGTGGFVLNGALQAAGIVIQSNTLTINAEVEAFQGGIEIHCTDEILVNDVVRSSGDGMILLDAANRIEFTAPGQVLGEGTGSIHLTADEGSVLATGQIVMADGSLISGQSQVNLQAGGDITVAHVASQSAAADSIVVLTRNGGVIDGGDLQRDFATPGGLQIVSATGVGTANPLETDIQVLNVANGSGAIAISNAGALQISGVDQQSAGAVRVLTESGGIELLSAGSGIQTLGGDVTLLAETSGNVQLDQQILTAGGEVLVRASTGIELSGTNVINTTGLSADSGEVILEVIGTGDVILTGTVNTAGADFPAGQAFDAGNVQLTTADGSLIVTDILATGGAGTLGGNAGDIQLDATGGSILLQGELNAVGGAGSPVGASGLISLTASDSILDANDGVAMIRGGDFSALAGVRIGEISDFASGSGNGIELELTGQVIQAEVTSAGGEIHLRGTGDLIFATSSLIPGAGTAADVVLFSTGDLDLGQNPGAVVTSDGDRINLLAEQVLVLPNDGLDVGSGELRLKGVLDVVDPLGRSLGELRSEKLVFFSGAAGGDTELNTAVHLLDATISTPGQNLTINEADGLVLQQILVPDAVVTINAATVATGDVEIFLVDAGTGRIVVDTTASGGGLIHSAATDASLKSSELALLVTTGIANNDLLIVEADVLAAATVSGDIHIQNLTESLRIGQVGVLSGLTISAGTAADNILIETLQSLQVERAVTANGAAVDLAVSANSGAQLTVQAAISADEAITLTSGGQLLLESGAAVMTSQGNILLSAGENRGFATLNTVVDQGSILMNPLAILQTDDGAVKLFSTGDVEISQLVALGSTHPEAGLISITADFQGVDQSLATSTGAIAESTPESVTNLRGSQLQLMASTGVGANDDLRVDTQTVQVTNLTGDIQLTQIAGAAVPTVELNDIQNDQGAITIRSEDGAILTRNVQVTTAGSISLRAEDAGADGGSDLTVEGSVQTASGEIELFSATRDILLDGIIESLAGAITVRSDLSGTGQITMTDGSVIHAADGEILVEAPQDILLGQVASDAQSQAAITIHTLGALVDGGDAGQFDLMADQGTVILMTAQGIGDANSLETLVRELQITNTGSGRVQINEGSALLLNQILQQANDDVTITSAGTMQLLATGAGIELSGGDLQMQTLGALSQLELLQSVSTAGGMLQLLSGADLLLGENVQLVSSGGNLIAAAGQATPDASFTMALTSSIELGSGTGNIQASGAVSVAQISTTTQLLVTSLNSEIQNPFADQTVQFTANELGLSAAAGIGNGTMLSTAVNLLAAETTLAGNIAVLNQSGQLLTVGTVAGLTGVQHLGSVAGDIIIINQSPLMIGENVINFSGGDIELTALGNTPQSDLTVAAPVLAQIPGEIRLNAGHDLLIHDTGVEFDIAARSITGRAENTVEIDRNVIIRSATGSVIDKLPLLEGIVTPQVKATGEASVSGDFGRLFEQTFSIQVDWADGQIDTNPEAAPTPDSFTYEHRYFGNPDPNNPAAPIPILVSIFDDPNITFFEAGQEVLLPPILSFAEVPGEGLAGGIAFDLSIEVPELGSSSSSGIDLSSSTATVSIEEQDVVDQVADSDEQTFLAGRRITLRVLNSKGIVIEEILLEGAQAEELLSDFIGFVDKHQLPDGRYQILQQEPGEASFRIVFDLLLRNGRPADNSEGLQDRPPTENQ